MTASADGTIRQWNAQSGEQLHARPPYPLGIISLSVSAAGDRALYNSLEGLTQLMDLTDGSLLASHESYARDPAATQQSEPGGFNSNLCGQAFIILYSVWVVSMHPKGETYASAGADGGVTIRSAAAADFGKAAHHLSPGKGRFGISVAHVSFAFSSSVAWCNDTRLESRRVESSHGFRKWPNVSVRYRVLSASKHIYIPCDECTFVKLVSR